MDIKLFVCCHRLEVVPKHPLLIPLQVGAALASEHYPGFLYDDTGENISYRNHSYCELTGQYWVWKNIEADYYGFFHYRRYLYPRSSAGRPYCIRRMPTLDLLDGLGYSQFAQVIFQHDLILPKGENMYVPVREHYASAPFHHREDLILMEQILSECYPDYIDAMDGYLSGEVCYFGNIFIMKRELFQNYCAWLFSILREFDERKDTSTYGSQGSRVNGYLAERLLGIYCTHHQALRKIELPRVHFVPESVARYKKQAVNLLLPPGSRRRSWVKAIKVNGQNG